MLTPGRGLYHPLPIGADFVRKNAFELIIDEPTGNPLSILCKNITMPLPKTNTVDVPWISGVMRLAGRMNQPFSLTAQFLVGRKGVNNISNLDSLEKLYEWRNLVFDHNSGRISLAHTYKKQATVLVYDITSEALVYRYEISGMWPSDIQDVNYNVIEDTVLEISGTFAADKIELKNRY